MRGALTPTLVLLWKDEFCGMIFRTSTALFWPSLAIWSAPITVIGLGEEKVERATREPVTTISPAPAAGAGPGFASCAKAAVEYETVERYSQRRDADHQRMPKWQ
ncbi:MAG: hypothetical protein WDN76_07740 [Alphaproteobacteria bacterium]